MRAVKGNFKFTTIPKLLVLNVFNRSVNNSINQEMKTYSFLEKCTSKTATDLKVVFNSFCTFFPKNEKTASKNFGLPEVNETRISQIITKDLLKGGRLHGSSNSKSPAKISAKFDIFLRRKTELETELEELLSSEKDDSVQPVTLKLRASDLKSRLASLGVATWISCELNQIDPIDLSRWKDQVSKNIAKILYRAKDKTTVRKGLGQTGFTKRDPPKLNGSV